MADEIEVIEWSVEVKRKKIRVAGEDRNLDYCNQLVYEQTVATLELEAVVRAVNGIV